MRCFLKLWTRCGGRLFQVCQRYFNHVDWLGIRGSGFMVHTSTKLSCCCGCGVTSYFYYDGCLMSLGIKRHETWRHKLYVLPSIAVSTLLPDNESTLDAQILLSNSVLQDCGLYRLPVSVSRVYSDHILMIYFKAWTRGLFAHSPVSGQNVWQRIKDIETHLKLIFVCAPSLWWS